MGLTEARANQREPGKAKGSQDEPGARASQGEARGSRRSQEEPTGVFFHLRSASLVAELFSFGFRCIHTSILEGRAVVVASESREA